MKLCSTGHADASIRSKFEVGTSSVFDIKRNTQYMQLYSNFKVMTS